MSAGQSVEAGPLIAGVVLGLILSLSAIALVWAASRRILRARAEPPARLRLERLIEKIRQIEAEFGNEVPLPELEAAAKSLSMAQRKLAVTGSEARRPLTGHKRASL
jgi:hypothetical protein